MQDAKINIDLPLESTQQPSQEIKDNNEAKPVLSPTDIVGQQIQKLLYPNPTEEKEKQKIQDRNIKLCTLRYLLRKNTPDSILAAYQFVQQEHYSEIKDIHDTLNVVQKAISHMEHEPLIAFCYLRLIECHLIPHSEKPGHLKLRALAKYLLGVLYSHERVPMSFRLHTSLDQRIEDEYQTYFFSTSRELSQKALDYFLDSYQDFSAAMELITHTETEKISSIRTKIFTPDGKENKEIQEPPLGDREKQPSSPQGIGEILPLYQLSTYKSSAIKKSLEKQPLEYKKFESLLRPNNFYNHLRKVLTHNVNRPKFDSMDKDFETQVEDLFYQYQLKVFIPAILFDLFLKNPRLMRDEHRKEELINYFSTYQHLSLVKILFKFYTLHNQSNFINLRWFTELDKRIGIKIQLLVDELTKNLKNKEIYPKLAQELAELQQQKDKTQLQIRFLEDVLEENKDTQKISDQTALTELQILLSSAEVTTSYDPLLDDNYFFKIHNLLEFFIAQSYAEIAEGMTSFYRKKGQDWTSDAEQKIRYLKNTKSHLGNALVTREFKRSTHQHPSDDDKEISSHTIKFAPYHESYKLSGNLYAAHLLHALEDKHSQTTVDCHGCMVLACKDYEKYLKITIESHGLHENIKFFIQKDTITRLSDLRSKADEKIYTMEDVLLKNFLRKKDLRSSIETHLQKKSADSSLMAASALFSGLYTAGRFNEAQEVFAFQAQVSQSTAKYQEICQLQCLALRLETVAYWVMLLEYNLQTPLLALYKFMKHINPAVALKIKNQVTTVHTFNILQQLINSDFHISADEKQVTPTYRDGLILLSEKISQSGHFTSEFKQITVQFEPLSIGTICADFTYSEYDGLMFGTNLFDLDALDRFLNKLWGIIFEKFNTLSEAHQEAYFVLRQKSEIFKITYAEFKSLNLEDKRRYFPLEGDSQFHTHREKKQAQGKRTAWLDKVISPVQKEKKYETKPTEKKSVSIKDLIVSQFAEEILIKWLAKNENINQVSNSGFTLLHMACGAKGNTRAVKLLLAHKAMVDITSNHGAALHIATRVGNTDTVSLLLDAKADVTLRSKGQTAAEIAQQKNNLVLQGLFKTKLDSDSDEDRDDDEETRKEIENAKALSLMLNK